MLDGCMVGIDVGGTFTDVVVVDAGTGTLRTAKVPTRTDDRIAGLVDALAAVDLTWEQVRDLVHGTTLVTNAVVERKLARVALIATEGFSDSLEIGRQNRRFLYRLDLPPKAAPQVPADRRFEVVERLDHTGAVIEALDPNSVEAAIGRAEAAGAEAVAVSLLHAYADPSHELAIGDRLRDRFAHVALSHGVNPEAREYERTATTVLSASVMPLTAGYLEQLAGAKPASCNLHLFHSAGGMVSPETVGRLPLGLALSGPAAGVAAAARAAREHGLERAISFDMGGTTTDVCLIKDGRAEVSSDRMLGDHLFRQPMVAVESIGAGGGSIARLDRGALRVGPESAGSRPGPACYGRGGQDPTVTDANLCLGYLDPGRAIGGGLALDAEKARAVVSALARSMDMRAEAAALGVLRVADAAMVRAIRRITVERGVDGRSCTLIAFGGAGPMHAVSVARALGIARVFVPAVSSAFSALGCAEADFSYTQQQTVRMSSTEWDVDRLAAVRAKLADGLRAPILAAGHERGKVRVEEVAGLRYRGQSYAVEVRQPAFDAVERLGESFREEHARLYGFATDEPWELQFIRTRASLRANGARPAAAPPSAPLAQEVDSAMCVFAGTGPVETRRFARDRLVPGRLIDGPAVIEDAWSTVVVPPGARLIPDAHGNLSVDAGADR